LQAMPEYIFTSSVVLGTSAVAFLKLRSMCKRRSATQHRERLIPALPRRISAPERLTHDLFPLADEARKWENPPSATEFAAECAVTRSPASSRKLSWSSPSSTSSIAKIESPRRKRTSSCSSGHAAVEIERPRRKQQGNMSPPASSSPTHQSRSRTVTPCSGRKKALKIQVRRDAQISHPPSPYPLSPSMMSQKSASLPFAKKECSKQTKTLLQEWALIASIRKKKLPLNKYGLPDVSADQLEKEMPKRMELDKMRKAFRDLTEEKLINGWEDGSGFTYVIDLFGQLLDLICSFVGRKQAEKFRKILDIDVLKQMVEAHVYTPQEFQNTLKLCVSLLYELESPYQHTSTQKWLEELKYDYATKDEYASAICDSIMYLFRKCDLCKMEVENYYISRISSADRMTQERLAFKKIPVPMETPWDCSTKENFVSGLIATIADTPYKLKEEEITSCLACDTQLLHSFQNAVQEATVLGVMSIVLNKIFSTMLPSDVQEFFESVVEAYYHSHGPDVVFDILQSRISIDDYAAAKDACALIAKCADVNDPLYKVLRSRCVKFLTSGDETENEAVFGMKPEHLSHANERAQEIKARLKPFVDEHWEVYGPIYMEHAAKDQSPRQW